MCVSGNLHKKWMCHHGHAMRTSDPAVTLLGGGCQTGLTKWLEIEPSKMQEVNRTWPFLQQNCCWVLFSLTNLFINKWTLSNNLVFNLLRYTQHSLDQEVAIYNVQYYIYHPTIRELIRYRMQWFLEDMVRLYFHNCLSCKENYTIVMIFYVFLSLFLTL